MSSAKISEDKVLALTKQGWIAAIGFYLILPLFKWFPTPGTEIGSILGFIVFGLAIFTSFRSFRSWCWVKSYPRLRPHSIFLTALSAPIILGIIWVVIVMAKALTG